jgi:hypothetical protein
MKIVEVLYNIGNSYSYNPNPYTQFIDDRVVCAHVLSYFPKIMGFPDKILFCLSDKPLKGYIPFMVRKVIFNYRWCDKNNNDRLLYYAMCELLEKVLHLQDGEGFIAYVKVVRL